MKVINEKILKSDYQTDIPDKTPEQKRREEIFDEIRRLQTENDIMINLFPEDSGGIQIVSPSVIDLDVLEYILELKKEYHGLE